MEDCSTDERLQQETLCRRQWTHECVERSETLMRGPTVQKVDCAIQLGSLSQYLNLKRLTTSPSSSIFIGELHSGALPYWRLDAKHPYLLPSTKPCGPQSSSTKGHHRFVPSQVVLGRLTPR